MGLALRKLSLLVGGSRRLSILRHPKLLAGIAIALCLLASNIYVAQAHFLGSWHWNKGGDRIYIQNSIAGTNTDAAERARGDAWNKISILWNPRVDYHTDVSVFDGNYGDTGWGGLAEVKSSSWDWESFGNTHITHAHARYNTYYPASQNYIQGVFCQEIGHTWGLDHSNTGDCMGLGYDNWDKYNYSAHNNDDFYQRYRGHITQYYYRAEYAGQSSAPTINRGSTGTLWFRFKNTGNIEWRRNHNINLGTVDPYTNQIDYNSPFYWSGTWLTSKRPTRLAEERVPPGGIGSFYVTLYAPWSLAPGTYTFRVRPVVDGVAWMAPQGMNVYLPVTVK